ncbi:MAG: chromate transporter [Lachnospiraceae bacterium]
MVMVELFIVFVKIGFTSFGGLSMIPLIMEEMQSHQWMSIEDLTNLIAIAEMTPGPIGINCATFAGMKTAKIFGGMIAVLGVITPTLTFTLIAAIFLTKFRESSIMDKILCIVKPVCLATISVTILGLVGQNYFDEGEINFICFGIGILMFYLLVKRNWSIPKVIILSALIGAIFF